MTRGWVLLYNGKPTIFETVSRTDSSEKRQVSSNEDNDNLVAELEAAAGVWLLNKNKYTLESLRDARRAVLKQMQPTGNETSDVRAKLQRADNLMMSGAPWTDIEKARVLVREAANALSKILCEPGSIE